MELENLDKVRMQAFNHMVAQKKKVSRIYNKKNKEAEFLIKRPSLEDYTTC